MGGFKVGFRTFTACCSDTGLYPSLCLFRNHRGRALEVGRALEELTMVVKEIKQVFRLVGLPIQLEGRP
jgi:hypothetical protein